MPTLKIELPLIETRLLNCFVLIAETGSLQKASHKIGKSKSTLSRWLSELEDTIGYEIFDRKSNGLVIEINLKGRALLPKAKSVLASLNRFSAQAYSLNSNETPTSINLAFNQLVENECLADLVAYLKGKHPEIGINVCSNLMEQVHTLLQDGNVDFVLTTVPEAIYPDIGGRIVGEEQVMMVSHPEHPLSKCKQIEAQQLLNHTLVMPQFIQSAGFKEKLSPLDTITTPDFALAVQCVKKGIGIAYVPEHAARQHLRNGEICQLSMNWDEMGQVVPLMLMFRLNYPFETLKNDLIDMLRQWFGYQSGPSC